MVAEMIVSYKQINNIVANTSSASETKHWINVKNEIMEECQCQHNPIPKSFYVCSTSECTMDLSPDYDSETMSGFEVEVTLYI